MKKPVIVIDVFSSIFEQRINSFMLWSKLLADDFKLEIAPLALFNRSKGLTIQETLEAIQEEFNIKIAQLYFDVMIMSTFLTNPKKFFKVRKHIEDSMFAMSQNNYRIVLTSEQNEEQIKKLMKIMNVSDFHAIISKKNLSFDSICAKTKTVPSMLVYVGENFDTEMNLMKIYPNEENIELMPLLIAVEVATQEVAA